MDAITWGSAGRRMEVESEERESPEGTGIITRIKCRYTIIPQTCTEQGILL